MYRMTSVRGLGTLSKSNMAAVGSNPWHQGHCRDAPKIPDGRGWIETLPSDGRSELSWHLCRRHFALGACSTSRKPTRFSKFCFHQGSYLARIARTCRECCFFVGFMLSEGAEQHGGTMCWRTACISIAVTPNYPATVSFTATIPSTLRSNFLLIFSATRLPAVSLPLHRCATATSPLPCPHR